MVANRNHQSAENLMDGVDIRSETIGVSQRVSNSTKTAALSYAVKHNLTMAETFERAVSLLIKSDTTPEKTNHSLSNIPDDAYGLSEMTLKFTKSEMKALTQKFGTLGLGGKLETLLNAQTDKL